MQITLHKAQSMMALFVYYLYTYCNNSPETCRKRFEGMTSLVYAPAIFGRQINDYEVVEWCKKVLNIDVSEIKIKTKIKRI